MSENLYSHYFDHHIRYTIDAFFNCIEKDLLMKLTNDWWKQIHHNVWLMLTEKYTPHSVIEKYIITSVLNEFEDNFLLLEQVETLKAEVESVFTSYVMLNPFRAVKHNGKHYNRHTREYTYQQLNT